MTRPWIRADGSVDPDEDLHGPPLVHPFIPVYLPEDNPVTVLHRAAGIEDPTARAYELTVHLAVAQEWVAWGSEQRDRAVLQMREGGASYDDVARALKVSKSRAQQLCQRLHTRYPDGLEEDWARHRHAPNVPGVVAPDAPGLEPPAG